MSTFKIKNVKQQINVPVQVGIKIAPKLQMGVNSIQCLNYPIDSLIEIINGHFDDQACSANYVVKALKVISISLKDEDLKQRFEKIIIKNVGKRQRIFCLMVYWVSILPNMSMIFGRIDTKVLEILISCCLSQICLTSTQNNAKLSKVLLFCFETLNKESIEKISQLVRKQYISLGSPFNNIIKSISKMQFENESLRKFMGDFANQALKSKESQQILNELLVRYFEDIEIRVDVDRFFKNFVNLSNYFIMGLVNRSINKDNVLNIWCNIGSYGLEGSIKIGLRDWISKDNNYWNVFEQGFDRLKRNGGYKQLLKLLGLGLQVQELSVVQLLSKKYLYDYLQGVKFEEQREEKMLSEISNKQNINGFHNVIETFQDLIKSHKNIVYENGVRFIIVNKIYAPSQWNKTDSKMLSSITIPIMKPFLDKLKNIFERQAKLSESKGQRIELAFHSIQLQIIDENEKKKKIVVSLNQLASILKQKQIPLNINLRDSYRVNEIENKKVEIQKQVQGIVVEARLVRVLKKSTKKLTFDQLFEEIKDLGISEEMYKQCLEKIISKGLVDEEENGFYTYSS